MTYYSTSDNHREKIYFGIAAASIAISLAILNMEFSMIEENRKNIVPSGFLIYGLLVLLFNNFLWKMWPLKFLINIPNLNGKWVGTNSKSDGVKENIKVIITQTWTKIDIVWESENTISNAIAANFTIENKNNYVVKFIYAVKPTDSLNENRFGEGCSQLKYNITDKKKTLKGNYFSSKFRGGSFEISNL